MPTLEGKIYLSNRFFLIGYVFYIFRRKNYEPNPSEMDIKVLILAPTQQLLI